MLMKFYCEAKGEHPPSDASNNKTWTALADSYIWLSLYLLLLLLPIALSLLLCFTPFHPNVMLPLIYSFLLLDIPFSPFSFFCLWLKAEVVCSWSLEASKCRNIDACGGIFKQETQNSMVMHYKHDCSSCKILHCADANKSVSAWLHIKLQN